MPVYNGGATIEEAIESLLAQTFTDFELLISDNGSDDATESICRAFVERDERVRYVRQRENRGGVANFAFVRTGTSAPYFMWAAADDCWAPRFLEAVVPLLDEDMRAVMAFTLVQHFGIGERGDWVVERIVDFDTPDLWTRARRYILQPDGCGKANLAYSLMRRDALAISMDAWSWRPFGSDMLFVFHMLLRGHCRIAREILFFKRHQPVSPVTWTLLGYLRENLIHSLSYVRVARLAGTSLAFRLDVLALASCKYARDLVLWSGWVMQAVARRMRRALC